MCARERMGRDRREVGRGRAEGAGTCPRSLWLVSATPAAPALSLGLPSAGGVWQILKRTPPPQPPLSAAQPRGGPPGHAPTLCFNPEAKSRVRAVSPAEEDRCGASVSLAGARSCGVGALGPFPRDPGRGRARRATEKRIAGQRLSESRASAAPGSQGVRSSSVARTQAPVMWPALVGCGGCKAY